MEFDRRQFLTASAAVLGSLAGCQTLSDAADGTRSGTESSATATPSPTPPSGDPPPMTERRLPLPESPTALRDEVRSGGVRKDGIPSIDEPSFTSGSDIRILSGNDIVFGVVRDGVAKAYPRKILAHHEICNDTVADTPVSITYCPLTGTALGFERGPTTLGVSGRLLNNNLVMYDRGTEQWWPQVLATAIPSPWHDGYTRRALREFRVVWTTWDRWRTLHPETRVLTAETGYVRNYEDDPYGGYDYPEKHGYYAPKSQPLFPSFSESDRYPPKAVVLGARTPAGAVAFRKPALRERTLMEGVLGDTPVLAVFDTRLETGYVYRNPDEASFTYRDGSVVDADGTRHAPDALPLERVHTFDAMWFAWNGFYPESNVYD